MNQYHPRSVEKIQLPLLDRDHIPSPEQVILGYWQSHSIDIGALCYLRRDMTNKRLAKHGRKVDVNSFDANRADQVRGLIRFISDCFVSKTVRANTLDTQHRHFCQFVDWCDANGHTNVLASKAAGRLAFRAYIHRLKELVSMGQLGNNTAAAYQNNCLKFLELFFDAENFGHGINMIPKREIFDTPVPVPSEDAQGMVMGWCNTIFFGISDLTLEARPYPHALILPDYLDWGSKELWVFPCNQWCKTPTSTHNFKKVELDYVAYDYKHGRIYDLCELDEMHGDIATEHQLKKIRARALWLLDSANKNLRHRTRLHRGQMALRIFMLMFIAATGMNSAQACSLPWCPELEDAISNPGSERQGFRSIKYRANNKVVFFEIGVKFMPILKRFMRLRKFLLNEKEFPYLFFGLQRSNFDNPIPLSSVVFSGLMVELHKLDPHIPKVLPREWRAAKQNHLVRTAELPVAARVMQHSLNTAIKKYSNGSEVSQQVEISNFLSNVEQVVLSKSTVLPGSQERSVGVCASPNNPVPINTPTSISANCKEAEGCFFCKQYRIHADETDTRKILSFRHCIRKTARIAGSPEQFERFFGVVLRRLGFILEEVRQRDSEMVRRVEHEVDAHGELDPYWAVKLDTLIELELL